MASENPSDLEMLVERIKQQAPRDDSRLQNYLSALTDQVRREEEQKLDMQKSLQEYEEAYQKLTAPANRIAAFLKFVDPSGEEPSSKTPYALIALGDTEYVTMIDPKLDISLLKVGTRVRVNEAYAVVAVLPHTEIGPIAKVSESLADGRLRIGGEVGRGDSRTIFRTEELKDVKINVGDEVRLDSSGKVALEHSPTNEMKDFFIESVPNLPWEKVGGQDKAIQLIRETIEQPLLHPELFARYDKKPIKGVLLYGPPGCGKTLIGKATAYNLTQEYAKHVGHEVKEYFMAISGPKILNMWLGETERIVRDIFRTARERAKEGRLVFIFMDEAESVLRTRSSGRYLNISNTVVPQFCAELDGLQSLDNVILMLTSNRPDYIDPAVLRPERIDRKVKISRPDKDASAQILGIYLHAGLPLDPEVIRKYNGDIDCARKEMIDTLVNDLWSKSKSHEFLKVFLRNGSTETLYYKDLVSGALLKSIVDRAKDMSIKRAIASKGEKDGIELSDLTEAMAQEYKENEIFPRSDTMEDWLQLLDVAPDNVASVKPIGNHTGEIYARRSVV